MRIAIYFQALTNQSINHSIDQVIKVHIFVAVHEWCRALPFEALKAGIRFGRVHLVRKRCCCGRVRGDLANTHASRVGPHGVKRTMIANMIDTRRRVELSLLKLQRTTHIICVLSRIVSFCIGFRASLPRANMSASGRAIDALLEYMYLLLQLLVSR